MKEFKIIFVMLLVVMLPMSVVGQSSVDIAKLEIKAKSFVQVEEWNSANAMYILMMEQHGNDAKNYAGAIVTSGLVNDDEAQIDILSSPLVIDGYTIKPVTVIISSTDENGTVLKFTLTEGRNRQIRKMCESVSLDVIRLKRNAIGSVKLGMLKVGKWRELTEDEVHRLQSQ